MGHEGECEAGDNGPLGGVRLFSSTGDDLANDGVEEADDFGGCGVASSKCRYGESWVSNQPTKRGGTTSKVGCLAQRWV
jgi:hypothetical protein